MLYFYRGLVAKLDFNSGTLNPTGAIIDGDTFHCIIDKGMYDYSQESCRLFGINTPELYRRPDGMLDAAWEMERKAALLAKEFLIDRISGKVISIHSRNKDKYGRPIVLIWDQNFTGSKNFKTSINQEMIERQLAKFYKEQI